MDIHEKLYRRNIDVEQWIMATVAWVAMVLVIESILVGTSWDMIIVRLAALCVLAYALWIGFIFGEHLTRLVWGCKWPWSWTGGIWGPNTWQSYLLALCHFVLVWHVFRGGL